MVLKVSVVAVDVIDGVNESMILGVSEAVAEAEKDLARVGDLALWIRVNVLGRSAELEKLRVSVEGELAQGPIQDEVDIEPLEWNGVPNAVNCLEPVVDAVSVRVAVRDRLGNMDDDLMVDLAKVQLREGKRGRVEDRKRDVENEHEQRNDSDEISELLSVREREAEHVLLDGALARNR